MPDPGSHSATAVARQRAQGSPDRHAGRPRDPERRPRRPPLRLRPVRWPPTDPRELDDFLLRGGDMRVIASVYTGSTEKRALDELVGLGAQGQGLVRDGTDAPSRQGVALRAELRLPHGLCRIVEPHQSALLDGLEWNVRATSVDNPAIIGRIGATFEQYWNEPEFESYDPRVDGDRLQAALDAENSPAHPVPVPPEHPRRAEAVPAGDARGARRGAPAGALPQPGRGAHRHRQDVGLRLRLPAAAQGRLRAAALRRASQRDPRAEPGGLPARPGRPELSASGSSPASGPSTGITCSRRSSRSIGRSISSIRRSSTW